MIHIAYITHILKLTFEVSGKYFYVYIYIYIYIYKEKLSKEAHERYQNLSEEEKGKKGQYHCDRNKNLSEEKKSGVYEKLLFST